MMSYASLVEPMRAANLLAGRTLYDMVNFATSAAPVPSSGAAVVMPQAMVGDAQQLDYLFVVAGGDPTRYADRAVMNWLARLAREGVPLGGVSGGPIILARAGLMAGRRMTVHWEHAAALAEISPHLAMERTLYVIDRDRVTCAGGTAAMDLMHALIAQQHGADFARQVSDWFMHTDVRPSVGPQRAGLVERVGTPGARHPGRGGGDGERMWASRWTLGAAGGVRQACRRASSTGCSPRSWAARPCAITGRCDWTSAQSLLRNSAAAPDRDRAGDGIRQLVAFLARLFGALRALALVLSLVRIRHRARGLRKAESGRLPPRGGGPRLGET